MKKIIVACIVILCFVLGGTFFYKSLEADGSSIKPDNEWSSDATNQEKEEFGELINYLNDKNSNSAVLKEIYYDEELKSLVINTKIKNSKINEADKLHQDVIKQLQLYNTDDLKSFMITINFVDGTPFANSIYQN